MEQTKEQLDISINQTPDLKIKELNMDLSTQAGSATYITDKINGELSSAILISDVPIDIQIDSVLGYTIFYRPKQIGSNYYSIAIQPIDNENLKLNYSSGKFILNEQLRIQLQGPSGSILKVILRYE